MPNKEAIKLKAESNSITPIKKSKYKVKNWTVYNKSLRNRGKLSLYFSKGDLRSQFINDESYNKGAAGRTFVYSSAYIEVIFIVPFLVKTPSFSWGRLQSLFFFNNHDK
jgi:hypothetical protein